MKIGELFVALGLKVDQLALARFNQGINNLKRDIFLMQAAFVGAAIAVDRFVDGTVRGVVSLQNLQNQTGLSIEKLQKLQQVGQLADLTLTPEAINQSVANLQKNIIEITRLGKGNFRPFQMLGIDPTAGDVFDVIDQLRERIKGLDSAVATNLIQELGLNPQFINILRLSREEFEKMSENTFLDPQQRNLILQTGTAMTKLKLQMKALKDQAVAKLAPLLIEITEKFFMWLKENGKKITDTLAATVRVMVKFVSVVSGAVGIVANLVENIFGLENGLKAIIAIFATSALISILSTVLRTLKFIFAGVAMLFAPLGKLKLLLRGVALAFSPITLVATALFLVLEDIIVWIRGGDSLFKQFFNTVKGGLGSFASKMAEVFASAAEKIKTFFSNIATGTKAILDDIKNYITNLFDSATDSVIKFFTKIKMFFLEMKNFISDTILEPIKKLEDFFNGKVNSFLEKFTPSFMQGSTGNTDNRSTTNNVRVEQSVTIDGSLNDIGELGRVSSIVVSQLVGGTT